MTIDSRFVARSFVQFARGWPQNDDGWELAPYARALQSSTGFGQTFGEAELLLEHGLYTPDPAFGAYHLTAPEINGQYIRILEEDESGSIDLDGITCVERFHGTVVAQKLMADGSSTDGGGVTTWRCEHVAALLDTLYIWRGHEESADGFVLVDPGRCLVFNDHPAGDRRATKWSSLGAYVHARERISAIATPWRAVDVVEYLLAAFGKPTLPTSSQAEGGITWTLDDNTGGVFGYQVPRFDAHGMTIAQVLNALANQSRGLGWRVNVNGADVTVEICRTGLVTRTVGGISVAAASKTNINLDDDIWIAKPELDINPPRYDFVYGTGARPWVTLTLEFKFDNSGDLRELNNGQRVWQLANTYRGLQYDQADVGLRHATAAEDSAPTGSRSYTATIPQLSGLIFTDTLPAPEGWPTITTMNDGLLGASHQKAVVVIGKAGTWREYEINVKALPGPNLEIGTSDEEYADLEEEVASDESVLVTIGVREWAPIVVAHVNPADDWPRDLPRPLLIDQPELEQWVLTPQTVKGAASGSLQTTGASEILLRDDTTTLKRIVAQAAAAYTTEGGNIKWTERGIHSTSYPPGTVIGTCTNGGIARTANAVITRRTYKYGLEKDHSTTWEAEQITPSQEGFA